MGHYRKLYEKIKRNPKDVNFKDLDKLLRKVGGFERRNPKGGSSHYTYFHPDLKEIITVPKDKPLKPFYVKRAMQAFEHIQEEFD